MTIVFNNIPRKIGVPGAYFEFDGRFARTGLNGRTVRVLMFGFMDETSGTANMNVPYLVNSQRQADTLFGQGSMLASMFGCASSENQFDEIHLIAVEQVGVEAEFTATFTGAPTDSGYATLYVGTDRYQVPVLTTDTITTIADALVAEIADNPDATYTATAAAGVLTIKMNFKGEIGNDLQVSTFYEDEALPEGLDCVIANSVAGVGVPDVSDAIVTIQNLDYTDVAFPFTDDANMDLIEAEADSRWLPLPAAGSLGSGEKDFHIYSAFRGTESEIATWHEDRNNQHVTVMALEPKTTVTGTEYMGSRSPVWLVSAAYAGMVAYYSGQDPNGNLQNIQFLCLQGAPKPSRFPFYVRNRLILNHGMATYKYSIDGMGDDLLLERATTCCRFTLTGQRTDAEMDTETQKLNSFLRYDLRTFLLTIYPRHKLADDGPRVSRNSNVTTPNRIRAQIFTRAQLWADNGYIENLDDFKAFLAVERSTFDCNTVNILVRPDHVNQLRVFAGQFLYKVC